MGMLGGPVLLTTPNVLHSAPSLYIAQNNATLTQAYLFGGTATLFPLVETQVSTVLNQS